MSISDEKIGRQGDDDITGEVMSSDAREEVVIQISTGEAGTSGVVKVIYSGGDGASLV